MEQPTPIARPWDYLISRVEAGDIQIPRFQRDFVWSKRQTATLIDSILKGYPIGTFVFWKTQERLRAVRELGGIKLREPRSGDAVQYVLDGQQRITSLFAIKKGITHSHNKVTDNYKEVWINLDVSYDDEELVTLQVPSGAVYISVYHILEAGFTYFNDNFDKKYHKKIEEYFKQLTSYSFSTIELAGVPTEVACEVFARINTSGTVLTLFEIMVAKTYDETRDFDLSVKFEELVRNDGREKDLEDVGYESVPSSVVLQCISARIRGQVSAKEILQLSRDDVIDNWESVKTSVFLAVDFLKNKLTVPVSGLLPYNALLVEFSYFFLLNKLKQPTTKQDVLLRQYFWWAAVSERFSAGTERKMIADLARMQAIAGEQPPDYGGEQVRAVVDDLKWRNFSTSDGLCRAILCLLARFQPRSFVDTSLVRLDNQYLIKSNSKNYHHFFPKKHLQRAKVDHWKINTIINITLVDEHLNKGKIKDRAPSDYIAEFAKSNKDIMSSLRSHLIGEMDEFGITDDDYERFIQKRAELVAAELNKMLPGANE